MGFNIYPQSKRYIPPHQVLQIWQQACLNKEQYDGKWVIVSVMAPLDILRQLYEETEGQAIFQLHGSETLDYIEKFYALCPHARIWQALSVEVDSADQRPDFAKIHQRSELLLLDTAHAGHFGGTGAQFDWGLIAQWSLALPWGLAGGIGEHNIEQALLLHPSVIDVCSGSELAPRVKDFDKIRSLQEVIAKHGI